MHLSKLEAARRQLESAIRLFFVFGDPVSIHTLTSAARGLLRDLAKADGREAGLDAGLLASVRPEKLKEVRGLLSEAQNFFKHADTDPDAVLEFNPTTSEAFLWDACVLYSALTGHKLPLLVLFESWFALSHPDLLEPAAQAVVSGLSAVPNPVNRTKFMQEMLPEFEELLSGGEAS